MSGDAPTRKRPSVVVSDHSAHSAGERTREQHHLGHVAVLAPEGQTKHPRITVEGPDPLNRDLMSGVAPDGQLAIDLLSQPGGVCGGVYGSGLRLIALPCFDLVGMMI